MRFSPTLRTLAALLVAAGVLALFAFKVHVRVEAAGRTIGVLLDLETDAEIRITDVEPDSPAERAGISRGDVVVALDGHEISSGEEWDEVAEGFAPGEEISMRVRRKDEVLSLPVRPGVDVSWGATIFDALVVLSYLGLAGLCSRQSEDSVRTRLLFLFLLAVAVEFALPFRLVADWVWIAFFCLTGLQMGLELHLASVIPDRRRWIRDHHWIVPSYYTLGLGLGVVVSLTFLFEGFFPWSFQAAQGLLLTVGLPAWAIAVPAILAVPAMRHPDAAGRHQAGLVLAGVLPWTALVLVMTGHEIAGVPPPEWAVTAEPVVLLFYPVAIFVAIFRYQLFDIEVVVRKSLLYTGLTSALLIVFYAALGAGGVLFSQFIGEGGRIWVVAGATLILGLLFTPLRRILERVIYRRFFPERVALRERLTSLAGELPALGKLPLMGNRLVERLGEILGIRWVTLLIADPASGLLVTLSTTLNEMERNLEHSLLLSPDDPGLRLLTQSGRAFPAAQLEAKSPALKQRLDLLRAEVAAPLVVQSRLVGLLILGPKRAGDRYLAEEMELLNLLAHHVAIVFENARLFESATRDSLTGLWRREAILERLDEELQRARRYSRPLSIGMADLDYFKEVNDTFGHLAGDSTLKWVSHLLTSGLRSTDHVGRYGGEEFLVILPETDLPGAIKVADKVRGLVEERILTTETGEQIGVTLSIGLATLEAGGRALTSTELIAEADRSLYRAKKAGRNQVQPAV